MLWGFVEFSRVSRVSRVRDWITVSVRIRVSLVLVTWSKWSYMSGSGHVATAKK